MRPDYMMWTALDDLCTRVDFFHLLPAGVVIALVNYYKYQEMTRIRYVHEVLKIAASQPERYSL